MKIFPHIAYKISKRISNKRGQYLPSFSFNGVVQRLTLGKEYQTSSSDIFTFLRKIKHNIGLRQRLNPKSFSDGSHTPKLPFVASERSVKASNKYLQTNCISENERIVDGFRDAGGGANFDKFGTVIYCKREVITIDRELDVYLRNAIDYVKRNTQNMCEKDKLKFIYNVVHDISGDAEKAMNFSKQLPIGKELLLGKIFEHGAAVCRHKALMFKILADEVGLQAKVLRGNYIDLFGYGRHVWNEVQLQDRRILVDVQNSNMINISSSKKVLYKLKQYCTENNNPMY